jgi:hypothetical protein
LVKHLLNKHEALSSSPKAPVQKKKKERKKRNSGGYQCTMTYKALEKCHVNNNLRLSLFFSVIGTLKKENQNC